MLRALRWATVGVIILATSPAEAQSLIVPDGTLGAEQSNVIENFSGLPVEVIFGGAQRGQNLFHSFREFNVSEGRSAYFFIPEETVRNVLTRVTGDRPSEILGRLGTFQQVGNQFLPSNANFFLINPHGVIFGANSSLDIGGSVVITTANAVGFANGELFSASTPTTASPLLTVDPAVLWYSAIAPQNTGIINRTQLVNATDNFVGPTTGLQVQNGRSLLLVGGDVRLENGYALAFGGGRVELGGLAGVGAIGLESRGNALSLNFPEGVARGDLILQSGAAVSFSGGELAVQSRNVTLTGNSFLGTRLLAGEGGDGRPAGNVAISATEQLAIANSSIVSDTLPGALTGSGNITIQAGSVQLANQGGIILEGEQAQGRITVNAKGEVAIDNAVILTGSSSGIGNNGDIAINAQTINGVAE